MSGSSWRRMRRMISVLAMVVLFSGGAFAASSASTRNMPDATVGDVVSTPDPQGHQVTDAVSAVVVDYSEVNGGVHWEREGSRVEVFLAPPTDGKADTRREVRSAVEAISRELPEGVSVSFVDVPYSFERQGELLDEVSRTKVDWAGPELAPSIVRLNIDARSGTIFIGATDRVPDVLTAARQVFGDKVKVFEAKDEDILQSRYSDTAPYAAGMAIWNQFDSRAVGNSWCTEGWTWRKGGVYFGSTAGHCRYSGMINVFHTSTTQRIGFISPNYYNNNEYVDFGLTAITSGSVEGKAWVGSQNTSTLLPVVDADNYNFATGIDVCSSGANGGLVCGEIVSRNGESTADGRTITRLTCVEGSQATFVPGSSAWTQGGDSGGPWLSTPIGGVNVKAWGQHRGISAEGCILSDYYRDHMLFSTVLNIAQRTGASIVVE